MFSADSESIKGVNNLKEKTKTAKENLEIDEIPENVLFNCAKLAKENSKASTSLNVSVDYCYAKFVKKASGSRPGMVIYNNFKTIIVK